MGRCNVDISGCLFILCCIGPAFTIVGIVFISSAFSDGRGERIEEFGASVAAWNSAYVDRFSTSTGWQYSVLNSCSPPAIANNSLVSVDAAENLGAESKEVHVFGAYKHVKFADSIGKAAGTVGSAHTHCVLKVEIFSSQNATVGTLSTQAVVRSVYSFSSLGCTQKQRTRTTKDKNGKTKQTSYTDEGADVSDCRGLCSSRGGVASGSSYRSFSCTIMTTPSRICVRVAETFTQITGGYGSTSGYGGYGSSRHDGWAIASGTLPDRPSGATGSGCFYVGGGWQAAQRRSFTGSTNLQVAVEVRHQADPYLYFLDISNGTLDFGLTTKEKLQIGITFLTLGGIIMTILCCAGCCIIRFAWSFARGLNTERPRNPTLGTLYDVSAKYGGYIPCGSAAKGVPVPTTEHQKQPPVIDVEPQGGAYVIGTEPSKQPGSPPDESGYPIDHSPSSPLIAAQPTNPDMPPGCGDAGPPEGAPADESVCLYDHSPSSPLIAPQPTWLANPDMPPGYSGAGPPPYAIASEPSDHAGSPPGVSAYPYDHSPHNSPTSAQQTNPNMPPGYFGASPPPYAVPSEPSDQASSRPGVSVHPYDHHPHSTPRFAQPTNPNTPPGYAGAVPSPYGGPPPGAAPAYGAPPPNYGAKSQSDAPTDEYPTC